MWDQIFSAANLLALISWIILILAPRPKGLLRALFYGPVLVMGLTYFVTMTALLTGAVPTSGGMDFDSIEGVRSVFTSDVGVTIGWIHYLCFDLFVGLWIARNADTLGISRFIQAPLLALTFMFGPVGLVSYIIVRFAMRRKAIESHTPA